MKRITTEVIPEGTNIHVRKTTKNKRVYVLDRNDITIVDQDLDKGIQRLHFLLTTKKIKLIKPRKLIGKTECAICKSKEDLTIDHVIPRAFYDIFGSRMDAEYLENYEVFCAACNVKKGHKIKLDDEKIFQKVLEYIFSQREKAQNKLLNHEDRHQRIHHN